MQRFFLLTSLSLTLSACVYINPYHFKGDIDPSNNKPSPFGLEFRESKYKSIPDTHQVSYEGDDSTSLGNAIKYTYIASIDFCKKQGKVANWLGHTDKTTSTVGVNSYTTGGYKTGNYYTPTQTNVYAYEKVYPHFELTFVCASSVFTRDAAYDFEKVEPLLIKEYVDDFQAAVLVKKAPEPSILKVGDVILRINGKRMLDSSDVDMLMFDRSETEAIEIVRAKKRETVNIKRTNVVRALDAVNDGVFKSLCDELIGDNKPPICPQPEKSKNF